MGKKMTELGLLAALLTSGLAAEPIQLPPPATRGSVSLEQALSERRSVREFSHAPLRLAQVSQVLWAAQGVTENEQGLRTAPSAGALYPLEILLLVGSVQGLSPGLYGYQPREHRLVMLGEKDLRPQLKAAALNQEAVLQAPAVLIVTAVPARTEARYAERAERYVNMEAGHVAQNICLQATALGLGAVPIGAFHDQQVARLLRLPVGVVPLYLLPVGQRRSK